jgi:hypothetical protein
MACGYCGVRLSDAVVNTACAANNGSVALRVSTTHDVDALRGTRRHYFVAAE